MNVGTRWTKEAALESLRRAAKDGRAPLSKDMRHPSVHWFAVHFGSWSAAVAAAGLVPTTHGGARRSKKRDRKRRARVAKQLTLRQLIHRSAEITDAKRRYWGMAS